jgi:hypothetical protein
VSGSGDLAPRAVQLDTAVVSVDADVGEEASDKLAASFVVGDGVDGGAAVHKVGGLLERGCDLVGHDTRVNSQPLTRTQQHG